MSTAEDTAEGFLLPPRPVTSLEEYRSRGGGEGLDRARRLGPDQTIQEVHLARLRGRGGAGFPTGTKWRSIRSAPGDVKYLAVNAAEGEPGTFKDRALMRANPYQLLEGVIIAALAVGAREAFLAVKHSFSPEIAALRRALEEMGSAGWLDVPVRVVEGPDEYLFGEEKALLEVIEGNAPLPRQLPPYQYGLFATGVQLGWAAHGAEPGTPPPPGGSVNPTLVNNVETLSNVPHILARGAEWFRGFGTEGSPGIIVCTVVGDVVRDGVGEVEMGVTLRDAIDRIGGGVPAGRTIKAVFSGVSNPVLVDADLDTPLTYEDFASAGSGLGAAGFIVYDDTTCVVELALLLSRFLYIESCGQCPACKLGTQAITEALVNLQEGQGSELDIEIIGARLRNVTDGNRCALPIEEQNVVSSLLRHFAEEFVEHLEGRGCTSERELVVPKLVDIVDGRAVYDEHYRFKLPDWTYADGTPPEA
ncbi:MAG TPA: NADH-ubiquinone oxidoreductase-F iron-sulfur binding region domain-containing protein [Acidimicrobiales bacterium]